MSRRRKQFRLGLLLPAAVVALIAQNPVLNESMRPGYFESLSYPLAARLSQTQGTVVVWATLDEGGRVLTSRAISGAKALIPDVLANSRKWRFQPNDQKAVVIIYRFIIEGLCNLPCPSQFQFDPPNFVTVRMGIPTLDH